MSDKTQTKEVVYLLRNHNAGFSIHNVFLPIINGTYAKYYEAPCERANLRSIFKNLLWVRKVAKKNSINHMTGGTHYFLLAIPFRKNVLTIHDLVLLRNSKGLKHLIFKWLWFNLPIMCSKVVTCITDTVRNDLLSTLHVNPNKVITIYNPVSSLYQHNEKLFNENCPRILHIGTAWNKNTKRVITALKGITCHLIIVGEVDEETISLINAMKIDHTILHGLTNEELYEQYKLADIISFPSIYEGFGMPIIEGQATGRPVLTSKIQPMVEVAGMGACFVDPYEVKSIRNGFLKIINEKSYRDTIIVQGTENVKRFSLETITKKYQKIYENML